ncbi:hypothetical protein HCMG_00727 [Helicobacter canadensis MIT 98-5491]|nr:hypothetical protein HCMG_00727 [Helicobacter canadensis MIT 98-5491]
MKTTFKGKPKKYFNPHFIFKITKICKVFAFKKGFKCLKTKKIKK